MEKGGVSSAAEYEGGGQRMGEQRRTEFPVAPDNMQYKRDAVQGPAPRHHAETADHPPAGGRG